MGSLAALSFGARGCRENPAAALGFGDGSTGGTQRMTEVQPHGSSLAQLVLGLVHWVLGHINDVAWIFV